MGLCFLIILCCLDEGRSFWHHNTIYRFNLIILFFCILEKDFKNIQEDLRTAKPFIKNIE